MRREELLSNDEKLFAYKWLFVTFVVAAPIAIAFEDRKHFLHTLADFMLKGLSWPLLVLVGLYFFRRRFLVRLLERGREVEGTVVGVKSSSGKMLGFSSKRRVDHRRFQVAVRIDGEERVIDVDARVGSLAAQSAVTVLVDPLKPKKGIVVAL